MSENYSDVNLYVDFAGFAVASLLIKMVSNAFVYSGYTLVATKLLTTVSVES